MDGKLGSKMEARGGWNMRGKMRGNMRGKMKGNTGRHNEAQNESQTGGGKMRGNMGLGAWCICDLTLGYEKN